MNVMTFVLDNIAVVQAYGAPALRGTALKHFEVDLHLLYFVCHCTTAPLTRLVQTLNVTSVSNFRLFINKYTFEATAYFLQYDLSIM